ncbi:MAG: endolytic transglycosylase MltG [Bdellovibrionaceae bacterium]|nr:endolytic transglycosylase MltG [Pseudobdellovibrionaceae bacterium]
MKYFLVLIILMLSLTSWLGYEYYQRPLSMPSNKIVMVRAGDSLRTIALDLQDKEVIDSIDMFLLWGRIFGHHRHIKTGEYGIPVGTTMNGLFHILRSGKSLGYKVNIPEGTNMYEIAQRLEEQHLTTVKDFMDTVKDKAFIQSLLGEDLPSLEGYLFPDTYFFTKIDGPKVMARKMVQHFKDRFSRLTLPKGWTRNKVVTLASIIEKETGAPQERPLISSVFHNRLNKDMKLQTDPTVIYAKFLETGVLEMRISREDLSMNHPYNTYRRKGLPPGPISNPGIEALEAAISPDQSDYLFFVSRNDGTHVFSVTYKDHVKAVGHFQLDPKAREGKSWRDFKKQPQPPSESQPSPRP